MILVGVLLFKDPDPQHCFNPVYSITVYLVPVYLSPATITVITHVEFALIFNPGMLKMTYLAS